MSDESTPPTPRQQRTFDRIWTQRPDRQNGHSSSWWFFILFPEGEDGYGPRQLMFAVATRAGDHVRVNDVPMSGLDVDRDVAGGVDEFDAIAVGWDGDDERVDENIVNRPARTTVSRDGYVDAWTEDATGARRGGEITASEDRPLGLEAHFVGDRGEVEFEAWGDLESELSAPVQGLDEENAAGNVDVLAYRRMRFEGEFDLPRGEETLEGLAYFQRVCFNMPLFPWKWIWLVFPDGTAFSANVPYAGLQLLRSGYEFLPSNALERLTIPVRESALWDWRDGDQLVEFDDVSITPDLDVDGHPDFAVEARTDDGDHLAFDAATYGHARNHIDRPLLSGVPLVGGRVETHWSYNEYLFQVEDLRGRVADRDVDADVLGQGYGTLEYAWGLGL